MSTILEAIQTSNNVRPKYTRYELGKLVRLEREMKGLTISEISKSFSVEPSFWESIESGSRVFNVKIYTIIESFLNKPMAELLEKEYDNLELISFRAQDNKSREIIDAIEIANMIFHEVVIQEKISV